VGVGKERGGVLAVGAREGQQGVRARVPAAGKVLEGDDKPTLSALYYDGLINCCWILLIEHCVTEHAMNVQIRPMNQIT